MRMTSGSGNASKGERIELLALPLASVEAFVVYESIPKTSAAMFGML